MFKGEYYRVPFSSKILRFLKAFVPARSFGTQSVIVGELEAWLRWEKAIF